MQVDIQERYILWEKFLERWPLEVLKTMTLDEYHTANDPNQDNLVNWLEIHTEKLGSIWGGSAFKFGIFNRQEHSKKENNSRYSYTRNYGWYTKYGKSVSSAYANIHKILLNIVERAQKGDIQAIEQIDFSPAVKWKLAFLYQPQKKPFMPFVYSVPLLQEMLGTTDNMPMITMYNKLMERKGDEDILTFSVSLFGEHPEKIEQSGTTGRVASSLKDIPLNQIFYGPPGTGKTWYSIDAALEILDPDVFELDNREERKTRFDELVRQKRIRFVTFHQSFSYEDFVEGIRPDLSREDEDLEPEKAESNDNIRQITYSVRPGIFREICDAAKSKAVHAEADSIDLTGRQIWKMSLGNSRGDTAYIYEECLRANRLLMGWGGYLDFSKCKSEEEVYNLFASEGYTGSAHVYHVKQFLLKMKKRDIVVVSEGLSKVRAIAEIIGDYEVVDRTEDDGYGQSRKVRWLREFDPPVPVDKLLNRQFSQLTLYRLRLTEEEMKNLETLLSPTGTIQSPEPHVLIIDEINRGNIAGIFGELITLIEPSKRAGQEDALQVRLPYSREPFSVPSNLYIIGTMNSTDRSLTGLDVALRRRFTFKEMCPDETLLKNKVLEGTGVSLENLLLAINERIEFFLDRDHRIGHAVFMSLGDKVTEKDLAPIFQGVILPLLQEYFFDDWERIHFILNDHNKNEECRFIDKKQVPSGFEEQGAGMQRTLWAIKEEAFTQIEAYVGIVTVRANNLVPSVSGSSRALTEHQLPSFVQNYQGTFMRACLCRPYTLVQYRDKGGSKVIDIYTEEEKVISGQLTKTLRQINDRFQLGITRDEERDTRHFADLILDKLNVSVAP